MARSILTMAVGVAVFVVSASALAQEESAGAAAAVSTDDSGGKIHLGLRLGYGIPLGTSAGASDVPGDQDEKLSDTYSGMIPIWLDLGYFVTPQIMLGLYGHYGIGLVADSENTCPEGADCSGSASGFRASTTSRAGNPWIRGSGWVLATRSPK